MKAIHNYFASDQNLHEVVTYTKGIENESNSQQKKDERI